jgi:hypothetical protein
MCPTAQLIAEKEKGTMMADAKTTTKKKFTKFV